MILDTYALLWLAQEKRVDFHLRVLPCPICKE